VIYSVGFHAIPMMPHVYIDPMNCSPNGTNIYPPPGQPAIPTQQQSPPTYPIFYSSSPTTPLSPWIPTAPPPPPPYFMLPNPQQAQHFPFQQLI
jgi:hypothetical protein